MAQTDHRGAMRGTVGRRAAVERHFTLTRVPVHLDAPAVTPCARRTHRYVALMTFCVALLVLAWTVIRLYSVPAAVGMTLAVMLIPKIAVIAANWGADIDHGDDHHG